jgi:hypothetical protein
MNTQPYIRWFADTCIEDVPLVGGKNASLGEMVRELGGRGVKIPNGFSITAGAYRHFIREAALDPVIHAALCDLDTHNTAILGERGENRFIYSICAHQVDHGHRFRLPSPMRSVFGLNTSDMRPIGGKINDQSGCGDRDAHAT